MDEWTSFLYFGCQDPTDEDEYFNDDEESEEERMLEIASNCTCRAYVIADNGNAYHIASCYCGAD